MKHYLDLIPISAKLKKRQDFMIKLCIVLSVLLITVIFGMADMEIRSQKIQSLQTDGGWHVVFKGISKEDAALIGARPEIENGAWYAVRNYNVDEGYRIGGKETAICGFEESFLTFFPYLELIEGEFAVKADEIVCSKSIIDTLKVGIGDEIVLELPDGDQRVFRIAGFFGDTSTLTARDAFGIFVNMDTYEKYFAKGTLQEDFVYCVSFKPYCNIQKKLTEIKEAFDLEAGQVGENTKLLALSFQSKDNYMMQLYVVAIVLAVIVICAGILMITGSMNSNIAQRTSFFGLLRCLGADTEQIIRFVRKEALYWCRSAVPVGIVIGIVIIWGLCGILRFLSPDMFSGMPVLGISIPSVVFGAGLGILTVLLAAQAPAKRAAKVSPLTAVSGNAEEKSSIKYVRLYGRRIETVLGVYHAMGSRKNYILMTGSFAFSILLFLSFSTLVDFMSYASNPLKPYAPDLSIYSEENDRTVPKEYAAWLEDNPAVKRVYGRSLAYGKEVTVGEKEITANLISYEKYQFDWAEDMLVAGETVSAGEGEGVLVEYDALNEVTPGEVLVMENAAGEQVEVPVTGILSNTPFSSQEGTWTVICSEELFETLCGKSDYTILDIQLKRNATEEDVAAIREMAEGYQWSDRRMSNAEVRGLTYCFGVFVYGFLAMIVLISVIHIINSISMSVAARTKQYGAMRAIGMSDRQLTGMIAAEAVTYAVSGLIGGCLLGLPLNGMLYTMMITSRWGSPWKFPVGYLAVVVFVLAVAVAAAICMPVKRLKRLSVVETIGEL